MIKFIRTILSSVTEGAIKRFAGSGRPGETFADREYFQHYGFTSRPLSGAEGILLKQGNNIILVASDDRRYRIELAQGEVALYTDEGDHIHMKRGNLVEVATRELKIIASEKVSMETPLVETTGEIKADLDITDQVPGTGRSMESMRDIYNDHDHIETGSTTQGPGDQM
ncbi:MAG: phage baseplate assembly protein [Desulfobacula sp.]|nr:phage baseplate assembly protein [Desulfobacula sp.]